MQVIQSYMREEVPLKWTPNAVLETTFKSEVIG